MSFYKGKKILITGHTGFKGAWLCHALLTMGAKITGYALTPPTTPNLYSLCNLDKQITSITADIRDLQTLQTTLQTTKPDLVIHMAAQPIVRESYVNPHYTYETNVMGTVNILESIRHCPSVKSFLNVTTDKVYHNNEWEWGYRETDPLNGYDPYSNSKSCSELVTMSYKNAFFPDGVCAISTARAGNVIGGGDFAKDRIIPDCIRAAQKGESIFLRNPHSVRPYQHVLEPLMAYLKIAQAQYENGKYAGAYNVGPDEYDCVTTGHLADLFCKAYGEDMRWETEFKGDYHEANLLKLDCSRIKNTFNWRPRWNVQDAVKKTVEWTKAYINGDDVIQLMDKQLNEYLKGIDLQH